MLARAVAGEAGVPFLFASGSSFDEMFVGVGGKTELRGSWLKLTKSQASSRTVRGGTEKGPGYCFHRRVGRYRQQTERERPGICGKSWHIGRADTRSIT